MGMRSRVKGACPCNGKSLVGDGGSRLAVPGSAPTMGLQSAAVCSPRPRPEGACMGLPTLTDPGLSPLCGVFPP